MATRDDLPSLRARLEKLAEPAGVSRSEINEQLILAWERTVNHFLEDGDFSEIEEGLLVQARDALDLTQAALDQRGAYTRLVRAGVIRDVLAGRATSRLQVEGNLPFRLQKSETLLWVYPDTKYLEDRTRREYRGGSQGVSVRVMKGVYYRVGAFKGHPVESVHRELIDVGLFGVTNRHLYFASPSKSFRIRHDKIVSLHPFDDGIGIHRDAQTAKPQFFITGDGWFTYNLVANAPNAVEVQD